MVEPEVSTFSLYWTVTVFLTLFSKCIYWKKTKRPPLIPPSPHLALMRTLDEFCRHDSNLWLLFTACPHGILSTLWAINVWRTVDTSESFAYQKDFEKIFATLQLSSQLWTEEATCSCQYPIIHFLLQQGHIYEDLRGALFVIKCSAY